jgi:ribosomal peptide maturation radical SAM protein 1
LTAPAASVDVPPTARRALLVYMPFGLIQIPSLGLSLLKAGVERQRIGCDVRYLNLDFVDRFCPGYGPEAATGYVGATDRYAMTFCAESRFSDRLFGPDPRRQEVVAELEATLEAEQLRWLASVGDAVDPFVDWCLETIAWEHYAIVGFSSVFLGMTVPSMLLAQRLKERHPWLVTVLGGPNTEGGMGVELMRRFPQLDYVLRGEADETWPPLVRAVLDRRPPPALPGLAWRDAGAEQIESRPAELVHDVTALPVPDCGDFVRAARATTFGERYRRRLEIPFESSRGCWWGETSHCKFCGINGQSMRYRSKPPKRMLDELEALIERYRPDALVAADAILDHAYYRTFLPQLAARGHRVEISYEIKANVRRSHVRELAAAGVAEIQPGIEALSTPLLRLVGKGSTALENLQCLRLAEEYGLKVSWYHLVGLPGERPADYEDELELLRLVPHLQPPKEIARFTLQRFSPYFDRAEENGVRDVRAMRAYRAVFPFPQESLDALAYHFDFEHGDGRLPRDTAYAEELLDSAVRTWKAAYGRARLDSIETPGGLLVLDARAGEPTLYVLDWIGASVYALLDRPRGPRALVDARAAGSELPKDALLDSLLGPPLPQAAAREAAARERATVVALPAPAELALPENREAATEATEGFVATLAEHGLVWTEGGRSIALAVPVGSVEADPLPASDPMEVGAT